MPPLNSIFDLLGAFGFFICHEHIQELALFTKPMFSDLLYRLPCDRGLTLYVLSGRLRVLNTM